MIRTICSYRAECDCGVADGEDAVECNLLSKVHLQIPAEYGGKRCGDEVLRHWSEQEERRKLGKVEDECTCTVDMTPFATICAPSFAHLYLYLSPMCFRSWLAQKAEIGLHMNIVTSTKITTPIVLGSLSRG